MQGREPRGGVVYYSVLVVRNANSTPADRSLGVVGFRASAHSRPVNKTTVSQTAGSLLSPQIGPENPLAGYPREVTVKTSRHGDYRSRYSISRKAAVSGRGIAASRVPLFDGARPATMRMCV